MKNVKVLGVGCANCKATFNLLDTIAREKGVEIQLEKVEEMEKFLKSYGLKWVGNKMEGKLDKKQLDKDLKQPKYNYRLPSEIDIRTVATRIDELNLNMHSEGISSSEA